MLRWFVVSPLVVLIVAAVGAAVCRLARVDCYPASLVAASAICLLSAELAIGVAVSQRRSPLPAFAQACLIALGAHLLLTLLLCGAGYLSGRLQKPFVYWAIAMFWATLITVSVVLARMLRSIAAQALLTGAAPRKAQ